MKKILLLFILLLLNQCNSTPTVIDKPNDYSPLIEEVQNSKDHIPETLKNKIVYSLSESQRYGEKCYAELQDSNSRLNNSLLKIQDLKSENETLTSERNRYRAFYFKFWFLVWGGVVMLIAGILAYFFGPTIMKILRGSPI